MTSRYILLQTIEVLSPALIPVGNNCSLTNLMWGILFKHNIQFHEGIAITLLVANNDAMM